VLRYQGRLEPAGELPDPVRVHGRKTFRRAQSEADAVQADREIGAHALEHMAIEPARAQVVLAVHLDPADLGRRAQEIAVVARAQPDPGAAGLRRAQPFFSIAILPALPCTRLPPIVWQVPVLTALKSFGS